MLEEPPFLDRVHRGPAALRSARVSTGRQRAAALPALLVVATFTWCAWLSWRRLGSLIIDGGRELDVPRRLLEGAVLYRDVAWYWGPLDPWLNSALYRVFGVSSDTLMWSGLVTAALACLGLYLIARRFVGPLTSAWVSVAFLIVCAFAKRIEMGIFNFVLPFNFSATYGITLAIWSVLLLLRHAESGAPATLAASAVLAGLAAMTKTEVALAVAAAHATFLVSLLPRVTWVRIGAWASGLAVAAGGTSSRRMPREGWCGLRSSRSATRPLTSTSPCPWGSGSSP